jgi:hypothetical protein
MIAIWIVLVLVLTGWRALLVLGISPREDRLAFAGWAIAAGLLLNALLLLALGWAWPGALRPVPITLAQAILIVVLGILGRRRPRVAKLPAPARRGWMERGFRAVVALALVLFVLRILVGDLAPALTGDEGMLWGLKARAIASAEGLGPDYLSLMARPGLRHEDYPLCNPLLQAWVLVLEGNGAILLRLPMQLGAVALLLSFAAALRRVTGPLVAAALVVIFSASFATAGAAMTAGAEGLVALGLVVAVDALVRYEREARGAWLGLAAIGLALALFTKNDAALFVLGILVGAGVRALTWPPARPRPRLLLWLAAPLATMLLTIAFNTQAGFANDLTHGKGDGVGLLARLGAQALDYLPTTLEYFVQNVFLSPHFDGLVGLLFLAALLLVGTRALAGEPSDIARLGRALVPAVGFLIGIAGLFVIYLATPQPLEWHLETSCVRVAWQVLPLAALGLAALVQDPTSA